MGSDCSIAGSNGRKRRALNPKAAIVVGSVALILIFGIRKLHSHQVEKTGRFLRESAMAALDRKDPASAYGLLTQYLAMQPSDPEAQERLAELLVARNDSPAALERAYRLNEDLLRGAAPQQELRLRHVRLAVRLNRYSDADAHLKVLQSARPESAEIWYLTGLVREKLRRADEAREFYERSVKCSQPVPDAFVALVRLENSRHADPQIAISLINRMVQACPSPDAHRLRAEWLMEQRRHLDAISDLRTALQEVPEDLRLNAMLVQCLQQSTVEDPSLVSADRPKLPVTLSDSLAQDIRHFEQLVRDFPQQALYHIDLAAVLWHSGLQDRAVATLKSAIQANPRDFVIHRTLVEYLLNLNRTAEAREVLEQVPPGGFSKTETDYLLGRIQLADEQWSDAAQTLDRCVAFGEIGSQIRTRAQLALAQALRNSGDSRASIEIYKSLLKEDPLSTTARLGLAAAWLDAGREDLAIAEYKPVMTSPGVPEYVAGLMIRRNLNQPEPLRNWDEVAGLIRDQDPLIADPVRRVVLQADYLLATGQVARALWTVEAAAARYPNQPELVRTLGMMNGQPGEEFLSRLQQILKTQPANAEAHAALLTVHLARQNPDAAVEWLESVKAGTECGSLDERDRLRVIVHALRLVFTSAHRSDRHEFREWGQTRTLQYSSQFLLSNPDELPEVVGCLAALDLAQEALRQIQSASENTSAETVSVACLEFVRFSTLRDRDGRSAGTFLIELIGRRPDLLPLRAIYAELLLYMDEKVSAKETLEQIMDAQPGEPFAQARLAWIDAVQGRNVIAAVRSADDALRVDPNNHMIRILAARIHLESGDAVKAAKVLDPVVDAETKIHGTESSGAAAAYVVEAAIRLKLNQTKEAGAAADQAIRRMLADPLLPEDVRLLRFVQQSLADRTVDSL